MPKYRVRDGSQLALNGTVHEGGAVVELHAALAADMAVAHAVEEIDAAGKPVAPRAPDDLARFQTHERVSMLRDRLADAKAVVAQLEGRIAEEDQRLADEVSKRRPVKATSPAAPAPVKEN